MSKGKWRNHAMPNWQDVQPKSKSLERFFATCGRIGGKTAAHNMTTEERHARAQQAAAARWAQRSRLVDEFRTPRP